MLTHERCAGATAPSVAAASQAVPLSVAEIVAPASECFEAADVIAVTMLPWQAPQAAPPWLSPGLKPFLWEWQPVQPPEPVVSSSPTLCASAFPPAPALRQRAFVPSAEEVRVWHTWHGPEWSEFTYDELPGAAAPPPGPTADESPFRFAKKTGCDGWYAPAAAGGAICSRARKRFRLLCGSWPSPP